MSSDSTQKTHENKIEDLNNLKTLVKEINLTTNSRKSRKKNQNESTKSTNSDASGKSHRFEDVYLSHLSTKAPFCLCEADEVPDWQFQHRQLNYGYRTCETFYEAFLSLFYFHNEFINIWLHYLGTVALLWKAWAYYQQLSPTITTLPLEYKYDFYVMFVCIIMGNCFPILTSGLCHHFYCISQEIHRFCWYLDFIGMLSGITFVSSNFLYLTFYCTHHPNHTDETMSNPSITGLSHDDQQHPPLLKNYSTYHQLLTLSLGGYLIAMYLCWKRYQERLSKEQLFPKDRFPEFSSTLSFYSVFTYILSIGCSVYFHPQYLTHPILSEILLQSCLYPLAMAMGIVVFAQGSIPERFHNLFGVSQHFFDLLGHSHQLWHIVSFLVLFYWIDVIIFHYNIRANMTCPL